MTKKGFFCIILVLAFQSTVLAQAEYSNWYFGNKAGLDFNFSPPQPITNGAMNSPEGCASISTSKGELLFYTNSVSVWNKNHQIMKNGLDIGGDSSSTQSSIITKKPNSDSLYYIFTLDAVEDSLKRGLCYSIVNISPNYPLGKVIKKRIPLIAPVCEKICATLHKNRRDIWIITHGWNSDTFYSFLLTPGGISKTVKSKTGIIYQPVPPVFGFGDAFGQIKCSPNGKMLADAMHERQGFAVFSFNNESGKIRHDTTVDVKPYGIYNRPYGLEFSPDNSKLYGTAVNSQLLFQFSVKYDETFKKARVINLWNVDVSSSIFGLQLAPDGKIYAATWYSKKIGVINSPNNTGASCDFKKEIVDIAPGTCVVGLPSCLIADTSQLKDTILNTEVCIPDSTEFSFESGLAPMMCEWDFGDPSSGKNNISTLYEPKHVFSGQGTYTVRLKVKDEWGDSTTIQKTISVNSVPQKKLPQKVLACEGDVVVLDAGNPGSEYKWFTGDITESINVQAPGIYYVTISNGKCELHDSVEVAFLQKPKLNLPGKIPLCKGFSKTLGAGIQGLKYSWSTGDTTENIQVTMPGTYKLTVSNGPCFVSDSTEVFEPATQGILNHNPQSLCDVPSVTLSAGNGTNYQWQPGGEVDKNITVTEPGLYKLTYLNEFGCIEKDSVIVIYKCGPRLYIPSAFTPNGKEGNETFKPVGLGITEYEIQIFNRWGERVFYSNDMSIGWDGTFQGEKAPEGVYLYAIKYKGDLVSAQLKKGTISLLR